MGKEAEQFNHFLDYINFSPFSRYSNLYKNYIDYCEDINASDIMSKIKFDKICKNFEEEIIKDVYRAFGMEFKE